MTADPIIQDSPALTCAQTPALACAQTPTLVYAQTIIDYIHEIKNTEITGPTLHRLRALLQILVDVINSRCRNIPLKIIDESIDNIGFGIQRAYLPNLKFSDVPNFIVESLRKAGNFRDDGRYLDALGIGHTKFKKTQIGEIPDNWKLSTIKSILDYVTSGSRDWAKYYSKSGPILLRITNLDHDTINLDLRVIKCVSLPPGIEGTRTRVKSGDIIISITADIGMVAVIPTPFSEAYVNQHIALTRLREGYNPRFFARYISWKDGGLNSLYKCREALQKSD